MKDEPQRVTVSLSPTARILVGILVTIAFVVAIVFAYKQIATTVPH